MKRKVLPIYVIVVYIFLYLPIFAVIVFSFNDSKYNLVWKGFTFKWYESLLHNSALIDATVLSLTLAISSATIATILGTLSALCIHRYTFWGKSLLHGTIYLLTVSPDIVMGIALLVFFVTIELQLGFVTLLIAHITLGLPFVAITVLARLSSLSGHLIEAAKDLGASEWVAFRTVVLPLIMPALVAGWFLSFTLSIDDILISFFLSSPQYELLSLRIYSVVRLGIKPDINALSTIMFGITVIFIITSQYFLHSRRKI
ncbi:MAG: spermidine/putrescine ABC transporter permease PotC [Desulfovibrionaceae bacterium]